MSIDVRAIRPDEFRLFLETAETSFGDQLHEEELQRVQKLFEPERCHAAFAGDVMVGTAAAYPFTLTIPGGEVPAAGVTLVGVLPSHRRKGVLTEMMRVQLANIRERREPVAILWASEGNIYHRFGYGLASMYARIDLLRDRAVFRENHDPAGVLQMVSLEEAAKILPNVYERVRVLTPGMYARSDDWWTAHRLADPEHRREGASPLFCAVLDISGRTEGYALYRVRSGDWENAVPNGSLEVSEAIGTSPHATHEIWRFLFGVDLVETIRAWLLPVDHPLLLMLAEPRRLRFSLSDALWLRIMDVEQALAQRSYACDGSVVFEVSDGLCPWNAGRWMLRVSDGTTEVQTTSEPSDLRVDVWDLGSVYLGGFTFTQLINARRVEEVTEGAAGRADALFQSDRAPWCPEIF